MWSSGKIVWGALLSLAVAIAPLVASGQYSNGPEIHLNVLAVDKTSQPQTSLSPSVFHVFEDGIERPITSIAASDAPVSLALLIDCSNSMSEKHGVIKAVATAVTQTMPPGSEVMAVTFNERAWLDLPFTPTESAPLSFLDHLEANGGTALTDAIITSEYYFRDHVRNARRALIVFSDGMDNASSSTFVDASRSLQWPGAPTVYFARLPDPSVDGFEKRFSKRVTEVLASAGGGLALVPGKNQDPTDFGVKIAELIRSQYVLTFTTSDPEFKEISHKVDIRLADNSLKFKLLFQPSYSAPLPWTGGSWTGNPGPLADDPSLPF